MSDPNDELFSPDRCDAGIQIRRGVMDDEFVDVALSRDVGSDGEAPQKHITATTQDSVWSRRGLARRGRSPFNVGILVALRTTEELHGHTRGTLANGLTCTETTEAIIHASGYCGVPAALSTMKVAQEVLVAEPGPLDDDNQ